MPQIVRISRSYFGNIRKMQAMQPILSAHTHTTSMKTGAPRRRTQRILLVDDNPDNLMLLEALLSNRGYDVSTAASAEEARDLVTEHAPDLILLDVILPGRNGYDLCRELKEDPITRLIPVVLITGLADPADRVRGIQAGADDF